MSDSRGSEAPDAAQVWDGPQEMTTAARMGVVDQIVRDLFAERGDEIVAIGMYGSMGRGTDGPFSDLELFCVVNTSDEDWALDRVHGAGKFEVGIYSEDAVRRRVTEVEDSWAIELGEFYYAHPLYGDMAYFEKLREWVMSPPAEAFQEAICELIVGEIYELVGKVRNARARGQTGYLAQAACKCAEFGALMVGLEQRRLYSTSARMLEESLELAHLPEGYAPLCRRVMAGRLADTGETVEAIEAFWAGIGPWAVGRGIDIRSRLKWPWDAS